jgi:hypothetical protein
MVATPAVAPVAPAQRHDPIYENAKNTINTNLANLGFSRDTSNRRIGEDYIKNTDTAKAQNENNVRALTERMANQGGSFSGVHVAEQGKVAKTLQDTLGELTLGKARGEEDVATEYARNTAEQQSMLGQAEAERANRQVEHEKQVAADEALAAANKTTADNQRLWMEELSTRLTALAQPAPTPSGQMASPPNPQAIVQQAVREIPPPAAKTPQQQAAESGIDPRYLQKLLGQRGFNPGPVDGVMGIKTQQALAHWKQSVGLPATADITPEIFQRLLSSGIGSVGTGGPTIGVATSGPAKRAL